MAWFMNVHRSFWTIMIDTISDRWCTMLQCLVQPLPGWWRNREVSLAYPAIYFVVTKEFMIPRGLPGEVVTVAFGKVTQKRWPLGDIVARCEDLGLFEDQLRKVSWTPRVMD